MRCIMTLCLSLALVTCTSFASIAENSLPKGSPVSNEQPVHHFLDETSDPNADHLLNNAGDPPESQPAALPHDNDKPVSQTKGEQTPKQNPTHAVNAEKLQPGTKESAQEVILPEGIDKNPADIKSVDFKTPASAQLESTEDSGTNGDALPNQPYDGLSGKTPEIDQDVKQPVPIPVHIPLNKTPATEVVVGETDRAADKNDRDERIAVAPGAQNGVDDDNSSSPTVLWFALFSVVIVVSVAVYLHRSGLRAPSTLGFDQVSRHSEEIPLMTPVDSVVSRALLNLRIPASAVDRYLQAFHKQRISRVEQLDESTWEKLALPSAIELELRRRFEEASVKPRSAGLTLHRSQESRSVLNADEMEFDDWSFDDEEINNGI